MKNQFIEMLSGGHPNSLGKTEEVTAMVLKNPERLNDLFDGYASEDEVVRLRISSAFKRVFLQEPEWFRKNYRKFAKIVLKLAQPSALWTYALLCLKLENSLDPKNHQHATNSLKSILEESTDWIVLNNTMETLGNWANGNDDLKKWLKPRLQKLAKDRRKSVASRARKIESAL